MARKGGILGTLVSFVIWLTGIIVSLAVGFAMTTNGALNQSIPWLSGLLNGAIVSAAGWIVIILTILSVVLAIIEKAG